MGGGATPDLQSHSGQGCKLHFRRLAGGTHEEGQGFFQDVGRSFSCAAERRQTFVGFSGLCPARFPWFWGAVQVGGREGCEAGGELVWGAGGTHERDRQEPACAACSAVK